MLKANALGFERESRTLFSNLTFEVEPGSMLFVSGANGSGKSSLLKILAGISRPTTGALIWRNQPLLSRDPYFLAELLYIGHKIGIVPALTPLQNLQWLLGISHISAVSRAEVLQALKAVGLGKFFDIPCEQLSKGQCQRVALARLWIHPGACWILDEPLAGLDEEGFLLLREQCSRHLEQKGIIIVASHRSFDLNPIKQIELTLRDAEC